MLASFMVHLRPREVAPVGRALGRSLHGLFLTLVRQADPALAEFLHSDQKVKPFTVSMLRGRFVRERGRLYASPDETYRVRYTVLRDDVFQALSHVLLGKQLYREPVTLDGQLYDVVDIVVDSERSWGWAGLASYEQLVQEARPDNRITLQFASPTTFRQGDTNLLFPLPVSVFGSYLRRWQALSPIAMPEDGLLDFVETYVVATRYELSTRVVSYGEHQLHGFVGVCQFRVMRDDAPRVRALNTLADFALYAGTGQKAPQGQGQTRRVSDVRVANEPGEWIG